MNTDTIVWSIFAVCVLLLSTIDIVIKNRRFAALNTIVVLSVSVLFGLLVEWARPGGGGLLYISAWITEKSLAIDNLVVFHLIFTSLHLNKEAIKKSLIYGMLGAWLFRCVILYTGVMFVDNIPFAYIVLALILAFSGYKLIKSDLSAEPEMPAIAKKLLSVKWMSPILLSIVCIESVDLIFALDSLAAILAISTDMMIIYTSNIMAILGLRSLYTYLSYLLERLAYINKIVGIALIAISCKLFLVHMFDVQWLNHPMTAPIMTMSVFVLGVIWYNTIGRKRDK